MANQEDNELPYCYIPVITVSAAVIICNVVCLIKKEKIFAESVKLNYSSLACSHIIVSVLFLIFIASSILRKNADFPIAGQCASMSIIVTTNFAAFGNINIITYERFFAVRYASKYKQVFTNARRKKVILALWIGSMLTGSVIGTLSVIFSLPKLVPCASGTAIVLTLLVVTATYVYIKVEMSKRQKRLAASDIQSEEEKRRERNAKKEQRRLIVLGICIVCSFFFLSVPLILVNIFFETKFKVGNSSEDVVLAISLCLRASNGLVDPLLYFYTSYQLKKARSAQPEETPIQILSNAKDNK